jgi:hypothetical protein
MFHPCSIQDLQPFGPTIDCLNQPGRPVIGMALA